MCANILKPLRTFSKPSSTLDVNVIISSHYGNADHCEDSGVFKNFVGSYQILLFTLFAVLASSAFIFLGKESACILLTFTSQKEKLAVFTADS